MQIRNQLITAIVLIVGMSSLRLTATTCSSFEPGSSRVIGTLDHCERHDGRVLGIESTSVNGIYQLATTVFTFQLPKYTHQMTLENIAVYLSASADSPDVQATVSVLNTSTGRWMSLEKFSSGPESKKLRMVVNNAKPCIGSDGVVNIKVDAIRMLNTPFVLAFDMILLRGNSREPLPLAEGIVNKKSPQYPQNAPMAESTNDQKFRLGLAALAEQPRHAVFQPVPTAGNRADYDSPEALARYEALRARTRGDWDAGFRTPKHPTRHHSRNGGSNALGRLIGRLFGR